MRVNAILVLVVAAICAGCGTVSTGFNPNPYPVYGGTRQDVKVIGSGGAGVVWIIDVPFSFAADTLLLPLGIYNLQYLPPSVDPLKGWKSWSPMDEEPHPAGFYDRATKTWSKTLPPKHSPLDNAIKDDFKNYLNKHEPGYFESGTSFYEDNTGQHAVKIQVGRNGYYRIYIFMYDKNNVRTKLIRYQNGGYAC